MVKELLVRVMRSLLLLPTTSIEGTPRVVVFQSRRWRDRWPSVVICRANDETETQRLEEFLVLML